MSRIAENAFVLFAFTQHPDAINTDNMLEITERFMEISFEAYILQLREFRLFYVLHLLKAKKAIFKELASI